MSDPSSSGRPAASLHDPRPVGDVEVEADDLDVDLDRPPPPPSWAERLAALRLRSGLDARAAAWAVAALVGAGVAAWLLRPAPTPLEESLPVASSEAVGGSTAGAAGGPGGAAGPADAGDGSTGQAVTGLPSPASDPTEVVAHAAGAVVRPGVYRLPPGARVDDLVRAAGGLAPDADGARVNLAALLADGDRVYVPRLAEGDPPAVAGPDGGGSGGGAGGTGGGDGEGEVLIDINTASEAELDDLPGVGPSIAAAIVAHREANGPFTSVDDLLEVRGIGEAKLADIRPRARV